MQLATLLTEIEAAVNHDREHRLLADIWSTQLAHGPAWTASAEPYQRLGRRLLKLGYPAPAGEVARAALEFTRKRDDGSVDHPWRLDGELLRIRGLALARTGNPREANEIALQLVQAGHRDEETLGLVGRTYKDLALAAPDRAA